MTGMVWIPRLNRGMTDGRRRVDSARKFAIILTEICYPSSVISQAPVAQSDRATDF